MQGMTPSKLREDRGLTQEQVAATMGFTRPGVQRIERGKGTTTTALTAYAQAIGVDFLTVVKAWGISSGVLASDNSQ